MDFFPKSYEDSRAKFLKMVDLLPQPLEKGEWKVPSKLTEGLTVDHVYLPPTRSKKRLFVMISGVHGLEGYAGAAVQSLFMQKVLPRLDRSEAGFLLIHALNPYGFKYHTRSTENHVNLNRNCSSHDEHYRQVNAGSVGLSRRFIPRTPVSSEICQMIHNLINTDGRIQFEDVSLDDFIKTVGVGQFEDPMGLEFGGFAPEPQIRELTAKLRELMPGYEDIVLFDMHTGLGHRGRLHLLTGDVDRAVDPGLFAEMFKPQEDAEVYDFTSADSEGFYKTSGATNNLFPELATMQQRVCALTWEFGTIGHSLENQIDSLNRWLIEHQGLFAGYVDTAVEKRVKDLYLDKFRPADVEWEKMILETSEECFIRVFQRLSMIKGDVS